jgi:LemA protein
MKSWVIALLVIVGLVLLGVLAIGSAVVARYNTLVGEEEKVEEAWSQVENVYQRRLDLIPNLVETVKGVADFEQETLTEVTEARARAGQTMISPEMLGNEQAMQRFEQAQGQLSSALSRLLVTVERYPQLQASQAFRDLMVQLEGTENRIAVERRRYNEVARGYNTAVRRFPGNLVAAMFGFERKAYFEADAGADEAPRVEF